MRRQVIQRKVNLRPRHERDLVLPLDPRDPDIVRAKRLLRNRGGVLGPDRLAGS